LPTFLAADIAPRAFVRLLVDERGPTAMRAAGTGAPLRRQAQLRCAAFADRPDAAAEAVVPLAGIANRQSIGRLALAHLSFAALTPHALTIIDMKFLQNNYQ
jgi:hypothetical protein